MAQNPQSEWDRLPVLRPGQAPAPTPSAPTAPTVNLEWDRLPVLRPSQAGTPPPGLQTGPFGMPPAAPPDPSRGLLEGSGFSTDAIDALEATSRNRTRGETLATIAGLGLDAAAGAGAASLVTRGLATGIPRWAARTAVAGTASGVANVANQTVVSPTLVGTPPPDPRTLLENASDAALAGAAGEGVVAPVLAGAWRLGKDAVSTVAGKVVRRSMTPEGRAAAEYMEGQVLPGQVSGSSLIQFLDNIAGATFGRGRYNAVRDAQEREFQRRAAEIISEAGPLATRSEGGHAMRAGLLRQAADEAGGEAALVDRRVLEAESAAGRALQAVQAKLGTAVGKEKTGRYAQDLLTAAHESADRFQNDLYEDLWARGGQNPVDLTKLRARGAGLSGEVGTIGAQSGVQGRAGRALGALEAAEDELDPSDVLPGIEMLKRQAQALGPNDPRALRMLQDAQGLEAELAEAGDAGGMTARQLHQLKSLYGQMGRMTSGRDKGVFDQLYATADETLAESLGDDLYEQYRTAGLLHKQMKQEFEEGALAEAIKAKPTEVLSKLVGDKEALETIALARTKMGQQGWTTVQARVWDDLVRNADGSDKTPKQILTSLKDWSPDALSAVFHGVDDVIAGVRGPLTAAEMAQKEAAKTAGTEANLRALSKAKTYNLVGTTLSKADPEDIPKLRAAVGEEGWKKVESVRLQQLFSPQAGNDPNGTATAREFSKRLAQAGDRLEPTFGRETSNFLHIWGRIRNHIARKNPQGDQGRMYMQLATGGAIGGLITGLATMDIGKGAATSGLIVLSPYILARISTSPAMQRALIGAGRATIDGNAKLASSFIANLSAQLVREGLIGPQSGPPSSGTPAGAGAARGTDQPLGRGQGPGPGALAGMPPPQPPPAR